MSFRRRVEGNLTREIAVAALDYDLETGVFRWKIKPCPQIEAGQIAGALRKDGYRLISVNGERHLAHRLAWLIMTGEWPKGVVDHRDTDRGNNAWSNLRQATKSQNAANSRAHKDATSGVKGVHWHAQRSKWAARICINGRCKHLGLFETIVAAKEVYDTAARELYGDFARPSL